MSLPTAWTRSKGLPAVRQWFAVRRTEKRLLPVAEALWNHLAQEGAGFLPEVAMPAGPSAARRRRRP